MRSQLRVALFLGVMSFALDACSFAPHETRAVYEPVNDAAAQPMAQLPDSAGEVVAVLQSRVAGVLSQRIVLGGDSGASGENAVVVKVDVTDRRAGDFSVVVPRPTQALIESELETDFPALDMRMSTTWNRNSFGPFGYAVGRAPHGVTCLYAWQYAQGRPPRLLVDSAADSAAASMPEAPTSVRVRLCRAHQDEREMLAWLRALQVFAPGSATPYADPAFEGAGPLGAGDALTAAGAPGPFFLRPPAQAEPTPRRQVKRPRKPPAEVVSRRPALDAPPLAGTVSVPLPGQAPSAAPAAAAAANPLLAPLKGLNEARTAAPPPPSDDMPLPGRLSGGGSQTSSAGAPAPAGYTPIPLPN